MATLPEYIGWYAVADRLPSPRLVRKKSRFPRMLSSHCPVKSGQKNRQASQSCMFLISYYIYSMVYFFPFSCRFPLANKSILI